MDEIEREIERSRSVVDFFSRLIFLVLIYDQLPSPSSWSQPQREALNFRATRLSAQR